MTDQIRRHLLAGAGAAALGSTVLLRPAFAQQRFDVPYVPTRQVVVDEMLRLAGVGPGDFLIDLGSGDGRIVITAAREFGIRALGLDIDPQRVAEARDNAVRAGVADRVEFRQENIFNADFGRASVVTMYLLPAVNLRLRPRLLDELRPGTRVVSHDFHMDDWEPDRTLVVGKTLYMWTIPAQVQGTWMVNVGGRRFELALRQRFQKLEGFARIGERRALLWEGRLDGDRVAFTLIEGEGDGTERAARYEGRVEGDTIAGQVSVGAGRSQGQLAFKAERSARSTGAAGWTTVAALDSGPGLARSPG